MAAYVLIRYAMNLVPLRSQSAQTILSLLPRQSDAYKHPLLFLVQFAPLFCLYNYKYMLVGLRYPPASSSEVLLFQTLWTIISNPYGLPQH